MDEAGGVRDVLSLFKSPGLLDTEASSLDHKLSSSVLSLSPEDNGL